MAVPLEQFVQQLEDSGILAGDTLKDFIPPTASPKDAKELARELVRKKKLTKYQAEEAYKGKAKSLVLGNYVLMEKIGAGGMGQVFKAEHRRMKRIVAIKLLPAAMTKDKAAIARFEREVEAAAKISHPNIVAAHDADCANGVHFLVMELIEGSDLSALVKKNGRFPVDKAVNYVLQAAKGLEAAHKKGIVHRDIKPANLLLDTEGTVKILDMGLARLNGDGDAPAQADLTSTGTIMGTVDYMAPEQALDTKTADARADIYALGCSLYYLLTGKSVYDGDTLMKRLLAHREQPIPFLRSVRAEVPEQVEVLFRKMVAKKVQERYQSIAEVIAELERCSWGNEQTVVVQRSIESSTETSMAGFLKDISIEPTQSVYRKKVAKPSIGFNAYDNRKLLIGASVFGVLLLLAGLVVKLKTKDGTLVVTVNEPDAEVLVLNEEGKVEISQEGREGIIAISVDPGKHRLKVQKDGFTVFGQDFEIEAGGEHPITAKLVPLKVKQNATMVMPPKEMQEPAMAETTPAVIADGTKKPLAFTTPGFDQWVKDVAALPAEQQVEAVSKKLVELNPGFDGKLTEWEFKGTPVIEDGVVTKLEVFTDNVTDISPVRALVGLKSLACRGSFHWMNPLEWPKGKLNDISPLEGLSLTRLHLIDNKELKNLTPLAGMPLQQLSLSPFSGTDLSPLKDAPLEDLSCMFSPISDVSLLRGMRLVRLNLEGSPVTNVTSLRELPLTFLGLAQTPVSDVSSLAECKSLRLLDLRLTRVTPADVAPLQKSLPNCKIEWDDPATTPQPQ